MNWILSILFITSALFTYAQSLERSVVASAGSYGESSSLSLSYTLGETAVSTLKGADITLSQGFQQASIKDDSQVGIEKANDALSIRAFPNPTSGEVILELNTKNEGDLFVSLHDLNGKELNYKAVQNLAVGGNTKHKVDLKSYAAGLYFIRLSDKSGEQIQSIKVQKLD